MKGIDLSIEDRYSLIDKYYPGNVKIGDKIVQIVTEMLTVRDE